MLGGGVGGEEKGKGEGKEQPPPLLKWQSLGVFPNWKHFLGRFYSKRLWLGEWQYLDRINSVKRSDIKFINEHRVVNSAISA